MSMNITAQDRAHAIMRALDVAETALKHAMGAGNEHFTFCEVAKVALHAASRIADGGRAQVQEEEL